MATYKERQRLSFRYEGKPYQVYGYSDRELERKKTEKIEVLKRNEIIIESSMTVRAWSEQFIKAYKQNCMKDYVLDNYEYQLKHYILEEIGDRLSKMMSVNTSRIDYYVRYMGIIEEYNAEQDRTTIEKTLDLHF